MKETIIHLEDVSYTYENSEEKTHPAVHSVNLEVRKGEFLAVLGHNGSGKSTLAKLFNGILVPTSGEVKVEGIPTSDEKRIQDIRKKVGMVFQNPDNQIVATLVEDDVAFGPENLGLAPEEIRKRVDDALRTVGMYDFRLFEPHKLSGGQKQRVAIAGVIAMRTDCIIFDESTAMLDPKGRAEVMETAKKLNEEGITIVFITHFMEEAVQADRIAVMSDGRIIGIDTPKNIFNNETILAKAGIELPPAAKLAKKVRESGISIDNGVLTVEQCAKALFEAAKSAGVID
ncbi:MAG: energy-coupling factor transporter ATPase [Clostridia bacterium]|nr:energy-coupling factor transporter ATPase [Clostridia bacterium]